MIADTGYTDPYALLQSDSGDFDSFHCFGACEVRGVQKEIKIIYRFIISIVSLEEIATILLFRVFARHQSFYDVRQPLFPLG